MSLLQTATTPIYWATFSPRPNGLVSYPYCSLNVARSYKSSLGIKQSEKKINNFKCLMLKPYIYNRVISLLNNNNETLGKRHLKEFFNFRKDAPKG